MCDDTQNLNETESKTFSNTKSNTFSETNFFRYRIWYHLNKLAKARKTRKSPGTLGLKTPDQFQEILPRPKIEK